eukprot:gene31650-6847_t
MDAMSLDPEQLDSTKAAVSIVDAMSLDPEQLDPIKAAARSNKQLLERNKLAKTAKTSKNCKNL